MLKMVFGLIYFALLYSVFCDRPSITTRAPKQYVVNLDLPEEQRWTHVVLDHKDVVKDFQNIFKYCTSIVSQDSNGQIWHSRNLDYMNGGILTEMLKNITIAVDFQTGGKTVYSMVTYAGYIGVLTGLKPNVFTISGDERDQGSIFYNILVGLLDKSVVPVSFLGRDALANSANFTDAINLLAYTPTAASAYIILGGINPGEGAVKPKGRLEPWDIWMLDPPNGRWFEVETNYDHWLPAPADDDRRDPANKAMAQLGRHNISVQSLFSVMSMPPVLNKKTTYTTVMSAANPELMQTWIRV